MSIIQDEKMYIMQDHSLMREVKKYAKSEEVLTDKLVVGVKEMFESVPMNPKRTAFLADDAKSC